MHPGSEAQRLAALKDYGILDTPAEPIFDDLVAFCASYFGVPMSLISLVDDSRQWFKARVGLSVQQTPREIAFCSHAIQGQTIFEVPDALSDERFKHNPLVTTDPHIRFYAGAPLLTQDGHALGTLCLIDYQPRQLTEEQRVFLVQLSKQVMLLLELRRSGNRLAQKVAELEGAHQMLEKLASQVPGVLYQFQIKPDGSSFFPYASPGLWSCFEVHHADVATDAALVFERLHADDLPGVMESIRLSEQTMQVWDMEFRVCLPSRGVRWLHGVSTPERMQDGSVLWHGFINDVTERRTAKEEIHRLALYDALTELPNRRLIMDRIEHALALSTRNQQCGAVLYLDLDHFKEVNDAMGHSQGDALIKAVAQRLFQSVRAGDTVARMGGDEFVVLAENLGPLEAAEIGAQALAEKLRATINQPLSLQGQDNAYRPSTSIGITLFGAEDKSYQDLLRESDMALYRAKKAGRNRIAFYAPSMQKEVEERLSLGLELSRAIEQKQLMVYAQAQVDARGLVTGAELLLRWKHPSKGFISPDVFIPIAEDSHLIQHLGSWVLRQACLVLANHAQCGEVWSLSVNVSPKQFYGPDFVPEVRRLLHETGADPTRLILEVTEGLLIENMDSTLAKMRELVALGVRFSIDDFGTGYSSLVYLKKLPLHEIKVDKRFVQDVPHDADGVAIVEAILAMAQHLQLRTVAEGVETSEQAQHMLNRRCDYLQGYLYAKPVPLQEWLLQI